jgi:hypothetical protein
MQNEVTLESFLSTVKNYAKENGIQNFKDNVRIILKEDFLKVHDDYIDKYLPLKEQALKLNGKCTDVPLGFIIPLLSSKDEQDETDEASYNIAKSRAGIGELYPVIVDAKNRIIDGYTRKGQNPNWHEEKLPWIDTDEKFLEAQLTANFDRRKMPHEEIAERIVGLLKLGLTTQQIAEKTGMSEQAVRRHTPQEFKNPIKVAAGKVPKTHMNPPELNMASLDSAHLGEQTDKTSDTDMPQIMPEAEPEPLPDNWLLAEGEKDAAKEEKEVAQLTHLYSYLPPAGMISEIRFRLKDKVTDEKMTTVLQNLITAMWLLTGERGEIDLLFKKISS